MATDVRCGACGQTFQHEGAGQDIRCPYCQATVNLPSEASTPSAPSASTPSSPGAGESSASAAGAWHVFTCDGQRFGPITKDELDRWAEEKRLSTSCQIYQDGWPTWRLAREFYATLPPATSTASASGAAANVSGAGGAFAAQNPYSAPIRGDNPYSAPQTSYAPPTYAATPGVIGNQPVDAGQVLNYAWAIWSANLGLLVGVFVVVIGTSFGFSLVLSGIQQMLIFQGGDPVTISLVNLIGSVLSHLVQIYLGVGEAQIVLKLARGQPATFGELFSGGPRFWPVVGVSILGGLIIGLGLVACIIPGIFLALMLWPFYYVVVDGKASVMDSFSVAASITKGNRGTTFVLGLASFGITLAGLLAFCIGLLFAAPLVSVMWATAYLMMSAQLSAQPAQPSYGMR